MQSLGTEMYIIYYSIENRLLINWMKLMSHKSSITNSSKKDVGKRKLKEEKEKTVFVGCYVEHIVRPKFL